MPARPYFRSSIVDLEQSFESSRRDQEQLRLLLEELKRRTTNRAKALQKKVEAQLREVQTRANQEPPAVERSARSTARDARGTSSHADTGVTEAHLPTAPTSDVEVRLQQNASRQPRPPTSHEDGKVEFQAVDVVVQPGADSVLAAWLTLEVLSPQQLPDARELEAIGRQLVRLKEHPEPWREQQYWRRPKERAVYWMVYLGEIDLAKAMEAILKIYPDDAQEERSDVRGNTTLAVVVVDGYGRPIEDKIFLSSFAWGYGQVLAGRLRSLAAFVEQEVKIKAELEKRMIRQDEDGKVLPLTNNNIAQATEWLVQTLQLPDHEVLRPGIAIRVPQWGNFSEPPEPELLNSFFIEDLVKVRGALSKKEVGDALACYLGEQASSQRRDVVRDKDLVAGTVAPARTPLSRWPGPGGYPLVLMQQAAVNYVVDELKDGGLVAVNGPPGTGKTTLLRDVVAKVVLDRAIAMAKFDDPADAFRHVTTMKTGQAYTHLYKLDETLLGHEIVVASSNNNAVENISREIPSSSAIAEDIAPSLHYFQSVADCVAAGKDRIAEGASWGLAAAVLGNSANRSAFAQSFWWHKKRGMLLYLKAVTGTDVQDNDEDNPDEADEQKLLDVVTIEQPPRGEIEALERWRVAKRKFLEKKKAVEVRQREAQAGYQAVHERQKASGRLDDARQAFETATRDHAAALEKGAAAKQAHTTAAGLERRTLEARAAIDRLRPGFFARLFSTRSYRVWRTRMEAAVNEVNRAQSQLRAAAEAEEEAIKEAAAIKKRLADSTSEAKNAERALAGTLSAIEACRKKVGANLADEAFWAQDDSVVQLSSPWMHNEWQRARDELFCEAFALHRAFIDASAKPLRHNLRAALEVMKGRALREQQEPARRSIWASLFLVVPVVSTTFASTTRLFGPLGKEQLGWLLIDEAGQTVPQAAVGALWRAKRVVVIGDPMQIQPVVTTPPKLIRAIFGNYGVETEEWAAPEMSTQTLADRASWFGTEIETDDGKVWVGSPLRVHRRCENPMFKISNYVAYDNLMVYGTPLGRSEIGRVLGESLWINVDAEAVGKWCEAEGKTAIDVLTRLFDAGLDDPDIFFITPFRIVARNLRESIARDRAIADRLPSRPWDWVRDRVGTVHTFQGREANAVVIVLGAPKEFSLGARIWAGHPPNLLNVAVTRAKRRLYVIGNREAWRNAGAFSHLAQMLPVLGRPRAVEDQAEPVASRARSRGRGVPETPSTIRVTSPHWSSRANLLIAYCRACGAPAIPGDDVCYQCKGD